MAPSAACERGTEQTVDMSYCSVQSIDFQAARTYRPQISNPPHGLHSLAVLDEQTIEWQLNACHEI